MRMSTLMNVSPAGSGRPSTRDRAPREHLAERQRRDAAGGRRARAGAPAAPTAGGTSRAPPAARCTSRPVIVSSSVRMFAGVEAGGHLLQAREAANQQAGADEQHHRQRQLRDHEQLAHVLAAARRAPQRARARGSAAGVLQVVVQIEAARRAAPARGRTGRPTATEIASVKSRTSPLDRDLGEPRHAARRRGRGSPRGSRPRAAGRARRRRAPAARSRSAAGARCARGSRRAPRARRSPSGAPGRATAAGWRRWRTRSAARTRPRAIRISSERRTSPTTCSCSGTMLNVSPPLAG